MRAMEGCMEEFKVGEIVQLKSGGPKMMVNSVDGATTNSIWCQWFAGNKLESGSFNPESLKKVAEDEKTGTVTHG